MNSIFFLTWIGVGFVSAIILSKLDNGDVTVGHFFLHGIIGLFCGYLTGLALIIYLMINAILWIEDASNSKGKINNKINNFLSKKIF